MSGNSSPHYSKARLTVMVALIFTGVVALFIRTPPIVFMASMLCAVPLVVFLFASASARHLQVTRSLPATGTMGDVIVGQFSVCNTSRWPAFLVHVLPFSHSDKPDGSAHATAGAAAGASSPLQLLEPHEWVKPLLRPGQKASWQASWRLRRRGVHAVPPAAAGAMDPLGLYYRLFLKTPAQEITVLPRPVKLERLAVLPSLSTGSRPHRYATVVPDAMDFHGIRSWRPGEGIRRVHWKSTARSGQLHVVEWEQNTSTDVAILLDCSAAAIAGGDNENTFETSITIAASVAVYLLESGYQCDFFCWGTPAGSADPAASLIGMNCTTLGSIQPLLRLLATLQPVHQADCTLTTLAEAAAGSISPGRSVLLLASSLAEVSQAWKRAAVIDSGGSAGAIVLDAGSFSPASGNGTPSREGSARGPLPPASRIIRRGDMLAAALEQPVTPWRTASALNFCS